MASDANDNVAEENFNKFRESMYQYLTVPIKDFAAIKPQLLDIFKTHRPIRNVDYQYGLSKSLKAKSQLIIHEFSKNRSAVREYFKAGNQVWHCCECTRTASSKSDDGIGDLLVQHGIVFVKLEHDCAPRELSFVQKVQKLYKEKKVEEADAFQRKVFGSEDLNVPVKRKSGAAAKRGTEASSLKHDVDTIAEVRLRLAQMEKEEEKHPSVGDEQTDEENVQPEEAFTKIIENLKEYTNETEETIMANKVRILSILKTHHPVKICNYQYGVALNLRVDRRLIVFEWGDRRRVREYTKRNDKVELWRCRECFRLNDRRGKIAVQCSLIEVNDVVFVHNDHSSKCKPRDYHLVMIYQKFLEEGDTVKARAMARTIDFTYGQSFLLGTVNMLNAPSTSLLLEKTTSADKKSDDLDENDSKPLTNLKRKMVSGNESDLTEQSPVYKKSKLNKSTLDDTVTDEKDPGLFDEKLFVRNKSELKKMQKIGVNSIHTKSVPSTSIPTSTIYHFEKPSTSKLKEICDKLNTEYRNKAAKLWDTITFDQIDTASSKPAETHYFETENFYQILSIFFTGKSKQHEQIETTIIDAFREQLVSSGEISTKKFNKRYLDTVTDEHFSFIAKYLSCRILIFDAKNGIKKYGKWKSTTSIRLTLVVTFRDGYYSIVLKL